MSPTVACTRPQVLLPLAERDALPILALPHVHAHCVIRSIPWRGTLAAVPYRWKSAEWEDCVRAKGRAPKCAEEKRKIMEIQTYPRKTPIACSWLSSAGSLPAALRAVALEAFNSSGIVALATKQ